MKAQRKITLRSELIRSLIITSCITFLLVGGILSVTMFRWLSAQALKDLEFYMQTIQEQFAGKLMFLEEGAYFLKNNSEMERFFRYGEGEEERIGELLEENINLFSDSNIVQGGFPVVKDVYAYNMDLKGVGTHFYPEAQLYAKSVEWHLRNELTVYLQQDVPFYYQKNGSELDCIFTIYDDNLETLGYCAVVFDLDSIGKIYGQLEKYETFFWVFETVDDRIVGGTGFPGGERAAFSRLNGKETVDGEAYYYAIRENSFGLTSYILIPEEKMYLDVLPAFEMTGIISLSVLAAVLFVIWHFARKLSSPMRGIVEKLEQLGNGDFETRLGEYRIIEFQQIGTAFNGMAGKIDQLIKEVYETKLLAQESKIQYLQAQINPHFMFNVLSAMAIRLKMKGDEELYQMVTAFAGLMQGKLFRKDEVEICLEEEMEIVAFYLFLQKERFQDAISYDILWADEELKSCYIPRLCVEPLVENAVIHGLEPKGSPGHIQVSIHKKSAERIQIVVADNGVGFDAGQAALHPDKQNPGVGIMNIKHLIHNLYGEEYGLIVTSSVGNGTRMELNLPYKRTRTW